MPLLDYKLYLAPASGGTFDLVQLETFTLVKDPKESRADRLDFTCKINYDDTAEPHIEAGRIPGSGRFDGGARVELWEGTKRLFKGVITETPLRDKWNLQFAAHNDLWRLGRSVAEYQGEANVAAIFEPGYLRQAAHYPEGTLELDPTAGSPPQTEAYGTRGRRGWKLGPYILESNAGGDFEEVDANTFEAAPHKGLLVIAIDFNPSAQYRLKRVSVYQEGTHEVEDVLTALLSYPLASGGAALNPANFDFEASGVTVSTFVQRKGDGYISEAVSDLTGERYAKGYALYAQYDYVDVAIGDPIKILGRNIFQQVPPARTVSATISIDQPTSVEEVATRTLSTVKVAQPGNLLKTATITNHLTVETGWEPIYPNSGSPGVLTDGLSDEIYGKFKASAQGSFEPYISATLETASLLGRIIITAGTAKGKGRVLAYSVYGSNAVTLPAPGSGDWEPLPGLFEVEVNPAVLGGGLLQAGASLDVKLEDPREYRHLLVKCRGYKWGSSSKEGALSCIEIQVYGRQIREFEAVLQNTDAFGGQPIGPITSLTGTLTFSSGSQTVTGIGTAFLSEITQREIADGVAIKLAAKNDWLRVIEVVTNTTLKIAANCPAGSAGTGAAEKSSFINTYKPELLAGLAALGPMVYVDDNETEEDQPGAYLRAYTVLDEKSRFYQGVRAKLALDEWVEPFETVAILDTDHNAVSIPILVERVEITEHEITVTGVNYRA